MSNFRENRSVNNKCLKHKVTYFQQLMTIPHVGNVLPLCIFLLPANSSESSSSLLLGCMHSLFLCRDVTGNVLVFEQGFHKHRNVNLQSPQNFPQCCSSITKNTNCNCSGSVDNFYPMMLHFRAEFPHYAVQTLICILCEAS